MPALSAEQRALRAARMKKLKEENKKDITEMDKKAKEYSKTPEAKKFEKQYNELKPIIQQFVDEDITYTELKKYCIKNDIPSSVFVQVYTDIISEYEQTYHETEDYEDLNDKEKKLWRESYNNQKLLSPLMTKLSKLNKELKERDEKAKQNEESEEEKPKKETKKEVKKEVKKETKKPIIVKLQKLCNELNEESDDE
jgi:hypothetical protein